MVNVELYACTKNWHLIFPYNPHAIPTRESILTKIKTWKPPSECIILYRFIKHEFQTTFIEINIHFNYWNRSRSSKNATNVTSKLAGSRSFSRCRMETQCQKAIDIATRITEYLRRLHGCNFRGCLAVLNDESWIFTTDWECQDSIAGKLEDDAAYWPDVHSCRGRMAMFRSSIDIVRSRDMSLGIVNSWLWKKGRRQTPITDLPCELRLTVSIGSVLFCQYYELVWHYLGWSTITRFKISMRPA